MTDVVERPVEPTVVTTPRSHRGWGEIAALIVLALLVVGIHTAQYSRLSPFDELRHVDYAERLTRGHLVYAGTKVDQPSLREAACRGWDAGFITAPCDSPSFDALSIPSGEENTSYAHPPLYYATAGTGAKLLSLLPGVDGFVGPARAVGGVWLAGGMVALWYALGLLGLSGAWRLVVAASPAMMPMVFHASATVNPDGSALLVGAVALVGALKFERDGRMWWLVGPAVLAALTKVTNGAGLGIAALFVVLCALPGRRTEPARLRRAAVGAAVSIGVFVIVSAAWLALQDARNAVDPRTLLQHKEFAVDTFGLGHVVSNLTILIPPVKSPFIPPSFASPWWDAWNQLVPLVLVAAPLALLLNRANGDRRPQALGWSTQIVLLATGPLLVTLTYVTQHVYSPLHMRYGLSMLPAMLASLGLAARSPIAQRAVMALLALGGVIFIGTVGLSG